MKFQAGTLAFNSTNNINMKDSNAPISVAVPLYKLKNEFFKEFLDNYTQHTIVDESSLRKTYAPSIYYEGVEKVRDEIKDGPIWVSIETANKKGRLFGNVLTGLSE